MFVDRIQLLRIVRQFDNVATGAELPFGKLTHVYARMAGAIRDNKMIWLALVSILCCIPVACRFNEIIGR